MSEIIDVEQAILEKLRLLSLEQQQVVLNFIELLSRNTVTDKVETKLSLEQIAALPLEERYKVIIPSIAATAEDFQTEPELTEFAVLDNEDWEIEHD